MSRSRSPDPSSLACWRTSTTSETRDVRFVFDQVHYRGATQSGQQTAPNPNYGQPLYFQPAVAYRFEVEMSW